MPCSGSLEVSTPSEVSVELDLLDLELDLHLLVARLA